MTQPKAKFFPGDKVDVICDSFTAHCDYWVEWGDDRWHVKILGTEKREAGADFDYDRVVQIVREALRGGKQRQILIDEKPRPNHPPLRGLRL